MDPQRSLSTSLDRNVPATKLAVRHYFEQMKRDWKYTIPAFLLPAIGNVLVFYSPPLIIAHILGKFTSGVPKLSDLLPYVLLFAAIWSLGEIVWRVGIQMLIKAESSGVQRLYNNSLGYLFEKDIGFFNDNFSGALTKRVIGYSWKYVDLMDTLAFRIFASYLPTIFVAYVLWQYSPWLVLVLIGLIAVTGLIMYPLIIRRQRLVSKRETASNTVAGHIADTIANIDTVKAFAHEDLELGTHKRLVADYVTKAKRSWDYQNLKIDVYTSPLYVLTNVLGLALALYLGSRGIGNIKVVFISFSYFSQLSAVMWQFNQVYRNVESALTEAAQFTEFLLERPKLTDPKKPAKLNVKAGVIDMNNITFRYADGSGEHLFKDFNLSIQSGEKIALVGRSGGGKTTITRLLLRFMDIEAGAILIDGQDITNSTQKDLRQKIAYVPQEPAMFHRTLTENIRYGKLSATTSEIRQAAHLAHAEEFINKLDKGYETMVGERGVKLSGGQRQRIAIARALLKNAPILILDEATSALDSESEVLIQDALWKLMEERTAIVIAHRLSTIQRMDRIVVLDEGSIVEQGTHKELIQKDGVYAKLWAHQSGGFLED